MIGPPDVDPRLDVFTAFAAATRAGDADAVAAISEPDAVVWHNFDDCEADLDMSGRSLRWVHRKMPDVSWADVACDLIDNGFVWRALITGTANGEAIRAHTCMIVTLSTNGKVARTDEYIDPSAMAALSR